jgi:aminoglycoside phosphotransferase (APT) family kinase protein
MPADDAPATDATTSTTNTDSTELPGLNLPAVTTWLRGVRPDLLAGPLSARLVAGGRSNLTYLLDDGSRQYVLRRPPLGHVLATAHDMAREHRMISALAGTAVPVPVPIALCEDDAINGAPFYLMAYVAGRVLRRGADLADLTAADREQLARAMMSTLADLHAVDPDAVGLTGFGRPDGFMARQVRRWSTQLESSRSRDLPGIEALRDDLAASVPPPSAGPAGGIVHGDYRLDNLIVAGPGEPDALAVRAVLDWEMATVGEPLSDVGLLVAYWDGLGSRPNAVSSSLGPSAGFPPGGRLLGWYAEHTGTDLSPLPWYVGFGFFKIAVILEGIHYRFTLGQTVGAGFDQIGALVPELVDLGRSALAGYRTAP